MTRKQIFEEYEQLEKRRWELDNLILNSYKSKFDKLVKAKDIEGLKKILDEIPKPTYFNLMIFQAIRELKKQKNENV